MNKKKISYIDVDIKSIYSLNHNCNGCTKNSKCCCIDYEICIKKSELLNIIGYYPNLTEYCPHLKSDNDYENVFEQIETNLFSIDKLSDGTCVFAYYSDNKLFCSLHSAAINLSVPVHEIKPTVCYIWPLAISEGKDKILTIQESALEYQCNSHQNGNQMILSTDISQIIETKFGKKFKNEMELAAKRGETWSKIPLD